MPHNRIHNTISIFFICAVLILTGCNTTKHLKENEYLLRSNSIKLRSEGFLTEKGALKDNLESLVQQRPNTYTLLGLVPWKLWRYNNRYDKYVNNPTAEQITEKKVEPPVIYDSSFTRKSHLNMRSYLFHQGYFYASISDTTKFRNKKAYVTYTVDAGKNYLINKVHPKIDDSTIAAIVKIASRETHLKSGTEFTYTLLEMEQTRIATLLRDYGYYKFSNENVSFVLDTLNKQYINERNKSLAVTITDVLKKDKKDPALDIQMIITNVGNPATYYRYGVSSIEIYPDYAGPDDLSGNNMIVKKTPEATFKYHNYYVRENVILKHMFLGKEKYYAQSSYDLTLSKLNELGIFQSVRISFQDDSSRPPGWLKCYIVMSPSDKLFFNTGFEASNGTTYTLGSALSVSIRNRNLFKGANQWTTSLSGSIESRYDTVGKTFFDHFNLYSKSAGINTSIDFPKFLLPIKQNVFSNLNTPRTTVSAGVNLMDRVRYFTLINVSTGITYKWRETETKNWELSPVFINNIRLPRIDQFFKDSVLAYNDYLKKIYSPVFIEGENVAFIFSDREKKKGRNYWYTRLGLEEAGGLMSGINAITSIGNYAKYVKFDFDVQKFITQNHSLTAFRFSGGVGLPYGYGSSTASLPYIKQYFVGGAYSIRGWRLRNLGPGSYYDSTLVNNPNKVVDRTGDIKLELTGEYRFDMLKLLDGSLKINGALFADAGNIWTTQKSTAFPNGEFAFDKLGKDLALSSGLGVRIDIFSFVVLRFDLAFPLKTPNYTTSKTAGDGYPEKSGWIIKDIDPLYNKWRQNNLILNIAIGYPF